VHSLGERLRQAAAERACVAQGPPETSQACRVWQSAAPISFRCAGQTKLFTEWGSKRHRYSAIHSRTQEHSLSLAFGSGESFLLLAPIQLPQNCPAFRGPFFPLCSLGICSLCVGSRPTSISHSICLATGTRPRLFLLRFSLNSLTASVYQACRSRGLRSEASPAAASVGASSRSFRY
jgi:hypothetical protein